MDKPLYSLKEVHLILKEYKRLLRQRKIRTDELYLFGSYARHNPRPWSDIDIAVVSPLFGRNPVQEGVLLDEAADEVSLALEPHPVNSKEFRRGWDPFIAEIRKHGVKV